MAIDPLGPQRTPGSSPQTREAQRGQAAAPTTPAASEPAALDASDSLNLSDVAIAGGNDVPRGTLDAETLRIIAQRLASGEYDSTAAADRLAGKLLASGDL